MESREGLMEWVKAHFGLNSYEAQVYLALLEKGPLTAGELTKYTTVPRSRIYDVLSMLEKKGFVEIIVEKSIKYKPLSPEEAIENLKKIFEAEFVEKVVRLERLKETEEFQVLQKIYQSSFKKVEDPVLIRGRYKIYNTIRSFIREELKESLIISSDSEEEVYSILSEFNNILRKNNIKVTIVAPQVDKDFLEKVMRGIKVNLKKEKEVPGRFVIFDEKAAIVFLKGFSDVLDDREDEALLIRQRVAIRPLVLAVRE